MALIPPNSPKPARQSSQQPSDPVSSSSFIDRIASIAESLTTCVSNVFGFSSSKEDSESTLAGRAAPLQIKDPSIMHIETVATNLIQPQLRKKEGFDHSYGLIETSSRAKIEEAYFNFFLNQAVSLDALKNPDLDTETKERLTLMALHGYTKAASIGVSYELSSDIQVSPFLAAAGQYHRSTNSISEKTLKNFSKELNLTEKELLVVSSDLFSESLSRSYDYKDIKSMDAFEEFIGDALQAPLTDSANPFLINISNYMTSGPKTAAEIKEITKNLEAAFIKRLEEHISAHPADAEKLKNLILRLQVVAFSKELGETVLLIPQFLVEKKDHYTDAVKELFSDKLKQKSSNNFDLLKETLIGSGFFPSIDASKELMLRLYKQNVQALMKSENLPTAELPARPEKTGVTIPTLFASYEHFLEHPTVKKFSELAATTNDQPYLQILIKATVDLLKGLGKIDLSRFFKEHKIGDLLQIFYFQILNAMGSACLYKNNPTKLTNEIDLIHQVIQNILSLVRPYKEADFANSVSDRMTKGNPPVISEQTFGKPTVSVTSSGMHAFSSILGGVEAQKGSKDLNICLLKDCYFESQDVLESLKTATVFTLDGDALTAGVQTLQQAHTPIDLFVCEFHHNISTTRTSYSREDILGQIHAMHTNGLLANPCTIAIDSTINLEQSSDFRSLLEDPVIKQLILDGSLNIVLFRSAQKFDMLGMDNYSGGISISINKPDSFMAFNARITDLKDQLTGLSYQGLTHLSRYGSQSVEEYQKAISRNLNYLYSRLPTNSIFRPGSTNPMQISEIKDENLVFLDIKFPGNPSLIGAVAKKLFEFAKANKLNLTSRASFGFTTTNVITIEGTVRLTPGLESKADLDKYAAFFQAIQGVLDNVPKEGDPGTVEQALFAIFELDVSTIL